MMAAIAGFEPTTLRMEGVKSTNEPPHPTLCWSVKKKRNSKKLTGMPFVSRMTLGTCLADSCLRMLAWTCFTRSALNWQLAAICRKSTTLSSDRSLLLCPTHRLSWISLKLSTAKHLEELTNLRIHALLLNVKLKYSNYYSVLLVAQLCNSGEYEFQWSFLHHMETVEHFTVVWFKFTINVRYISLSITLAKAEGIQCALIY